MPSSAEFGAAVPLAPITPPAPGQHPLAWAMENPNALAQLIDMHNKMLNFSVTVVQNGETKQFPVMLAGRGSNAMIELQLPSTL